MIEIGLALGLVATLAAGVAAMTLVEVETLYRVGAAAIVTGLGFGVPTGLVYHLELRRALLGAGRLPARWWLRPTSLHGEIPAPLRFRVLAWCYAGAAGFVVTAAGCAVLALGALRAL